MNKGLQIFKNGQFGEIRATEINGDIYFVGKDLAERLGYENTSKAIKDHIDIEDKIYIDKTHPSNGIEFDYKELGQRGGYTRILKVGIRKGDNAEMAIIELL